jgi:triphosphoribosyl-dephospho-CoA synthase
VSAIHALRAARRAPVAAEPQAARRIAALAVRCLRLEAETWPKPGLVSPIDCGSHADMDIDTFRRSAAALEPYFAALAEAGSQGCAMGRLRLIGLDAEAAMVAATGGVNTHRGAIFGLGLLCAAAGVRAGGLAAQGQSLGAIVASRWRDGILQGPPLLRSHGGMAWRRYGAGGARREAARGFPSIYAVGLPALRRGAAMANDDRAARVQACFALIAHLEDTNLLHRAGLEGLRFARNAAREFLGEGGVGRPDWLRRALAVHGAFVARRLSPGGSADLLAMSLFVETCEATP